MKIKKNVLMLLTMLLCIFFSSKTALAQKVSENGFQGDLKEDNSVVLTSYSSASSVIIPTSIEGYIVREIGNGCFYYDSSVKSVEIPGSVKVIHDKAFEGCKNLNKVTFSGTGLEEIGDNAFNDCDLNYFQIPSTVKSIGSRSFGYCKVESITIPKSVVDFGEMIFFNSKVKNVTFEEGIKIIPSGMFSGSSDLTNVSLPNSIETIQDNSFSFCKSLNEVVIPASIKSIADYAFYCASIKKLVVNAEQFQIAQNSFGSTTVETLYCKKHSVIYDKFVNTSTNINLIGQYLNNDELTLTIGKTAQLKVMNPNGVTTWSSSNTKIATVKNGVVKGVSKGTVVITAVNNGVTMKCTVKVQGLSLNKKSVNVTVGYTTKLKLEGIKKVKWSSSNKKVATVSKTGVVKGIKTGKATITCTYKKKKYKCKVKVVKNTCTFGSYLTNPALYPANNAVLGFRKISMDEKGNLIVKGDLLNKYSGTVTSISNLTIMVFIDNSRVAKQTYSSVPVNVPAGTIKEISVKIDKRNVKKKKCDLRSGKVAVSFTSNGVYTIR